MTEDQIQHMVDRFLGWKLPKSFQPDNGISFVMTPHQRGDYGEYPTAAEWPRGMNLLDATQAEAMVRYMLEGLL